MKKIIKKYVICKWFNPKLDCTREMFPWVVTEYYENGFQEQLASFSTRKLAREYVKLKKEINDLF